MTQDEFDQHLLTSLRGPKAAEILALVLEFAAGLAEDDTDPMIARIQEAHAKIDASLHADLREQVWTLMVVAHLDGAEHGMLARRLPPEQRADALSRRETIRGMVSSQLAAMMRGVASTNEAAEMYVDLEYDA